MIVFFLLLFVFISAARAESLIVLDNSVNAIFANSYFEIGPLADEWTTVDVTTLGLPLAARAVFLQGAIRMTGGEGNAICNLYLHIGDREHIQTRSPDKSFRFFGIGQGIVSLYGQGIADSISSWVPLDQGRFRWKWTRTTYEQWPAECAYGVNLNIQAYTR